MTNYSNQGNHINIRPAGVTYKRIVLSSALIMLAMAAGCKSEKEQLEVFTPAVTSGPPRHWDIGDQTMKHQLPEGVSDGYLQFSKTSSMSYGMTLVQDRISARSHARAEMLIYVHAGTARFYIDDKEMTASTGDLLFIPRNTIYSADVLSERQLQMVTMYAPPLDTSDVIYHEAAERVNVPQSSRSGPIPLDTLLKVSPADPDKIFEQMKGSVPIEDKK